MLLGLGILIISTQRQLFSLNPSHNYYHSLIVDESIRNSMLPKVYAGDHLYFPNQNPQAKGNSFLWIDSDAMHRTYKAFSHGVTTISREEIVELNHFILVHDWPKEDYLKRLNASRADINRRISVNHHSKLFAYEIQLDGKLPE